VLVGVLVGVAVGLSVGVAVGGVVGVEVEVELGVELPFARSAEVTLAAARSGISARGPIKTTSVARMARAEKARSKPGDKKRREPAVVRSVFGVRVGFGMAGRPEL